MAEQGRAFPYARRGLPRLSGGEPWPPAQESAGVPADAAFPPASGPATADQLPEAAPAAGPIAPSAASDPVMPGGSPSAAPAPPRSRTVRRGLPRVPGEEPSRPQATGSNANAATGAPPAPSNPSGTQPRRGLPRAKGGPAEATQAPVARARPARTELARPAAEVPTTEPRVRLPQPARLAPAATAPAAPLPGALTEPKLYGQFTGKKLITALTFGGFGLLFAAVLAYVSLLWFLNLDFMRDFLRTYPGETHLPEGAPVGFPAWVSWQHFFNTFLMVLIVRSGLQVRTEKRPSVFWTPKWSRNGKGKISLNLWFHQALDLLWLTNGIVFVILLFTTGQWVRVVPTSWEVFPNAVSAALQYASLDWPTENGWVNYNSLQVLAYFVTIFLAAPLAAITGVRMSSVWPKNVKALNNIYPIEWARAVHFPVMLYFIAFIVVHVTLVFATGALRNLNHMYAAQGSVDPDAYAANWTGFSIFFVSLVVIAAGWIAARPLVLASIAGTLGKVGR